MRITEMEGTVEEITRFLKVRQANSQQRTEQPKVEQKTLFDELEESSIAEPVTIETAKETSESKKRKYRMDRWSNNGVRLPYTEGYIRIITNNSGRTYIYVLRQHKALLNRNGIVTQSRNTPDCLRVCIKGNVKAWLRAKKYKSGDRLDMDINKFIDEVKAI